MTDDNDKTARPPARPARRRFLRHGAGLGAAGALGAGALAAAPAAGAETLAVPPWTRAPGEPVLWRAYGQPAEFEKNVIRRNRGAAPMPGANSSMTPLQDLHGIVPDDAVLDARTLPRVRMPNRGGFVVDGRIGGS